MVCCKEEQLEMVWSCGEEGEWGLSGETYVYETYVYGDGRTKEKSETKKEQNGSEKE